MKKLFILVVTALVALCANAQVNSTRVELSPLHIDADNSDKVTWKFLNTDITISNEKNKGYASMERYGDVNGDTCTLSWMKVSKDTEFKINIPDDRAVVRIEFWGVSNSGSVMNWAYLHSLNNTVELPIFNQTGGAAGNGRDIMANEEIKALPYPYSPEAKNAETTPVAVFNDNLGWFSELTFMFDGNNQVGTNIVLYTVPEADLANYKTETDASIRLSLDKPLPPVASTRVELSPLHVDAANSDKATWKFQNTGVTITNGNNKGYASMDHYGDVNGDTCKLSWMKVSKDVEFKLNIPADSAVVRIEFWGVSNSGAKMNWAYLHSLNNTVELPIFNQTGGAAGDGRDIMDNEEIKALPYPYSPEAKNAETTPVAVFNDDLGWFSELSFMFDGNNQVGTNIVVYMVHESELENYKGAKDPSIRLSLDQPADPVASTRVELSPLYADFTNSVVGEWKFINTGTTITNGNNKSIGEAANYGDVNGDTCTRSFLKVSKDVEFKLNIPADSAVVRIEFWGFSNSGAKMNWAYLHSLSNTAELPIVQGIDRDVMDNEAIKALPYPYSPEAKNAEAAPIAVFNDNLGWFSELTFLFDGNNQVGTNIVLYMVHQDELAGYDWTVDPSIKAELDKPVIPDAIKVVPVAKPFNPNAPIYNLAGQQVNKNYKGIVIQNGKKFVLR